MLADGSHQWIGASFYLQIERCAGVAKQSCSVRLEEELYLQKAEALKENIDKFFEGAIEVWVVDVPTLYALEVRVMRWECHPTQHGLPVYGQDAVVQGAKTLFSKVVSKKWPRAPDICARLQEFSRIPVGIQLLCREQPQGVSKDSSLPLEVTGAINSKTRRSSADSDALLPLDHVTFQAIHSTGKEILFSTDADGRSHSVLHPGKFQLRCNQKENYDRLEPGFIEVPATFEPLQFTIVAKMKKRCTFQVVDHLNRPYPLFPMRILPKDGRHEGIAFCTKATGQVKGRLGVGLHVASYSSEEDSSQWPVEPLSQELEVQDIDAHQLFRIIVRRLRFQCEFVLRSRFDEPVRRCPFTVRSNGIAISGVTSDGGVATVELPTGTMVFHLEPDATSAFVATSFEVEVKENGDFLPLRQEVETKSVNVQLNLITPDGEPAPFCDFNLKARFSQDGTMSNDTPALSLRSDEGGRVSVVLALLEPYIFSVHPTHVGCEYMQQEFSFLTDRQSITVVVARSVLGMIQEENVVFVIDVSGSMQVYLEDVKSAVNLALVQQFHQTQRHFNLVTFTEGQIEFRDDLVPATPRNLEDAMRFCQHTQAGGGSNLAAAVRNAFRFKKAEAILVITDGKTEVSEDLLTQVKVHYLGHPRRAKVHTVEVGINCVPGRIKQRALQSLAHLTQGSFRSVCLEQDTFVPVAAGQKVKGIDLLDQQYVTTDEDTITDAVLEDPYSEDDRLQR